MTHRPSSVIHIDGKKISRNDPVYFIAEIGSNFDRDLSRASDLIYLAKEAGADAAKFQHYTAGSLVSDIGFRQLGGRQSHQASWKKSVFETYQDASLNRDWTAVLKQACDEAGITFFTSPYSLELVDYVEPFVSAYKVGSGDITWLEIIERMVKASCPPDGVVLDPFMGSGTTAVAAKRCGRNFVGFELNATYCEMISARLAAQDEPASGDVQLSICSK